jgi:site-specific recombinase XerC
MIAVIGVAGISWLSQRDHLLLGLLYNTGARVSEIIGVRVADVVLDGAACVHLCGKGRKQRSVPLWRSTVKEIRAWLKLNLHLYVFGLTTSSKELNPKNFFGNSALHRVKSSGNTRHSFPAS